MTNAQILAAARNNLNAATDTLWNDSSELLITLWRVGQKLARETDCMEGSFTTVTVTGTSLYTAPPQANTLWRVTYDGAKLYEMDYRQYDSINPNATTSSGSPAYYIQYNEMLKLYPTPATAASVIIRSYDYPEQPTAAGTITIPARYHDVIVDGMTYEMCPKDLGHPLTLYWQEKWEKGVERVKAHMRRKKRGDRFAVVKTEEDMLGNDFGIL